MITGFNPTRIPVDPDRAAGPRTRPRPAVGGFHFSRVFAKKVDVVLNKQHVRFAQPLRLFARPLPKLQKIREGQKVFFPVFTHADIPAIIFPDVEPQRVGSHDQADPDITIAQEHPFEEIRSWQISSDGMATGDLEGIEVAAFRRRDRYATHGLGGRERDGRGGVEELPTSCLH